VTNKSWKLLGNAYVGFGLGQSVAGVYLDLPLGLLAGAVTCVCGVLILYVTAHL
jgi:hypothetical protein